MKTEAPACITSAAAGDINRLHAEAVRLAAESGESLRAALAMAWRAGQILIEEKKRVRRTMGRGAWLLWLEQNFRGTPRTVQRYMLLSRRVADISSVQGMSLRLMYARLGIATEPKSPGRSILLRRLPPHVGLANKLLRALRSQPNLGSLAAERRAFYRQDLGALYERLRPLFETQASPAHLTSIERATYERAERDLSARLSPVRGSQPKLRLPGLCAERGYAE